MEVLDQRAEELGHGHRDKERLGGQDHRDSHAPSMGLVGVPSGRKAAVSVTSLHMPTSWANDEEWLGALEALDKTFIGWRDSHSVEKHIVGGDWNCCWSASPESCIRIAATKEFLARHKLYEPEGEKRSTCAWRHPAAGTYHQRRLDAIVTYMAISRHLTMSAGRSDHRPIAMLRDRRGARQWSHRQPPPPPYRARARLASHISKAERCHRQTFE